MRAAVACLVALLVAGCSVAVPEGIKPVDHFSVEEYLGTWYEIARLDHRFERGLSDVTATYSMRTDGGLTVLNRGWSERDQQWSEASGKAYFTGSPATGSLKVSFFGPFFGGYNILSLDSDYQHALVSGSDRETLWILARTPQPDAVEVESLKDQAIAMGFDLNELKHVSQDRYLQADVR